MIEHSDASDVYSREFRWAFAIASVAALLPLWVGEYLPMIDLPQHMAQVAIGKAWGDPSYHYQDFYQVNWVINHVLARLLAGLLSLFVSVPVAIKLVLSLSIIGFPLSVVWLLRGLRGDPFWALPAFAIAYGYAFNWGFFDFMLAAPLAVLLIAAGNAYATAPSRRRALALVGLAYLCFFTHILALGLGALIAGATIAVARSPRRARLWGLCALASVLPAVAGIVWATRYLSPPSSTSPPFETAYGVQRFHELLSYQLGLLDPDWRQAAIGAVLLGLPFAMGGRPSRDARRWVALALTLCVFFALPKDMFGVAFVYGRYAVFVLPALVIALRPGPRAPRLLRWLSLGLVVTQLGLVSARVLAFDREASSLNVVLARMLPNKRVLYLATHSESAIVAHPAYLHFGCYYQVKRGGPVDFSFAEFFANRYRYRKEQDPNLPPNLEWEPRQFRWAAHGGDRYDYLLVRGPVHEPWFSDTGVRYTTVAAHGPWKALARTN